MEWMFVLTAWNRVRVESRILQVLDHHMVALKSFASVRIGKEIRISLVAQADEPSARRTADLLRKLQDVQTVDAFAATNGVCRTLALFKVLCDHESRLALLQVISSLKAQDIAIHPDSVTFQIIGTLQDIHGLHESLLPYGLVQTLSMASAVVRRDSLVEEIVDTDVQAEIPEPPAHPHRQKPTPLRKVAV